MNNLYIILITVCLSLSGNCLSAESSKTYGTLQTDSTETGTVDSLKTDSAITDSTLLKRTRTIRTLRPSDTLNILPLSQTPFISPQQWIKGNIAGTYVQEPSGESGTIKQNIIIRGAAHPVLNASSFNLNKPVIFLNGIPLIEDPSIVYNIQNDSYQPLGPASNSAAILDLDNIESIEVLKDYSTSGIYGPRAANGAILITTKNAVGGRGKIDINSYYGFATPPSNVSTFNAATERDFRKPFYDRYATLAQQERLPVYLSDSSNINYYGPSNWTDLYYNTSPVYTINASLTGGSDRSNFRFFADHTSNTAAADDVGLKRYNGTFYINMLPTKWLTMSAMIQATRLERDRNRSFKERFSEMRFLPDMSTPMSPNKDIYSQFLNEYKSKSFDDNINNSIQGYLRVDFQIMKNLRYTPQVSFDYNESARDLFWPSTLMSGNNYVSDYFGYNQRYLFEHNLNYMYSLDDRSVLTIEAGQSVQYDVNKYNYTVGYKGPNDFIKINVVDGDPNHTDYLQSIGFIPYFYSDRIKHNLASFYGRLSYSKENVYSFSALLRSDGSSNVQPKYRWFTSPVFSAQYNLNSELALQFLDRWQLFGSWGRMGNVPMEDRLAAGPQYTSQLGWNGNNAVFSFNGFGSVTRPYNSGWIGYDMPWSYTDMLNLGTELSFLKDRFTARVEVYSKDTKDISIEVPTVAESGYESEIMSGMHVNNKGIDVTLSAQLLQPEEGRVSWSSSLNFGVNQNKLKALPDGLDQIIIGNRILKVGERIDRFWLLKNEGIYDSDLDVPVDPSSYKIMTYNGVPMHGGDPRWADMNGDYNINNDDRVMMGNVLPKVTGGFFNEFTFGKLNFNFMAYFNLGREVLNAQAAKYYDFANTDEGTSMDAVREITFWEKNFGGKAYPMYNPWSSVTPYQAEQDMFMEDGSFVKLRNVSLGYDFVDFIQKKNKNFRKVYIYITASNLWTYSKYSGRDPELSDYYGYDTGDGLRIPATYILGVKIGF